MTSTATSLTWLRQLNEGAQSSAEHALVRCMPPGEAAGLSKHLSDVRRSCGHQAQVLGVLEGVPMTCIVGLVHEDKVYMGGDSAGVSGLDVTERRDEKVFRNGEFLMGFTSSFRMGQLIRYAFAPPPFEEDGDLYKYMVTHFVNELRKCLKEGGIASEHDKVEACGCFLAGIRGRLFTVESDYQVGESLLPYDSVGCGQSYALGSLHATDGVAPYNRVLLALSAAEVFSGGVRAPFTILELGVDGVPA